MKEYHNRQWLNPPMSADSGWMAVHMEEDWREGVDSWMTVSDCERSVTLSFSFHHEKGRRGRIKKIDNMISFLEKFKAEIEAVDIPEKKESEK